MQYMALYPLAKAANKLHASGQTLFTTAMVSQIVGVSNPRSQFDVVNRLVRHDVLSKIDHGLYGLVNKPSHNFVVANFIYEPSYISFETALNYHGVLSQFPTATFSATTRRTKEISTPVGHFNFIHIKKELFWGFDKSSQGFLMAAAEKALLDQAYLAAKGLKMVHWDEYALEKIDKSLLHQMAKSYPKLDLPL